MFLSCADDYTDEMCFMIGVDFYSRILDWPFDYNGPLPSDGRGRLEIQSMRCKLCAEEQKDSGRRTNKIESM